MITTSHRAVKELNNNSISTIFIVNTIALLIVGLLIIYYVVQANIIAASSYNINLLSQKLESLNDIKSSLVVQKSAKEDLVKVLDFALSQNMVEAKNAIYFFENPDVALRP
ncbi:MAG TPA: hypothetical protein VJC06_02265 [Candidatus Paceibacterota bacterium]